MVTGGNIYYGEPVAMHITMESLCCASGTNIILHVDYIQLKLKKIFKKI